MHEKENESGSYLYGNFAKRIHAHFHISFVHSCPVRLHADLSRVVNNSFYSHKHPHLLFPSLSISVLVSVGFVWRLSLLIPSLSITFSRRSSSFSLTPLCWLLAHSLTYKYLAPFLLFPPSSFAEPRQLVLFSVQKREQEKDIV